MSSNDGIGRLRAIEQQFDGERASVVDRNSLEDIRDPLPLPQIRPSYARTSESRQSFLQTSAPNLAALRIEVKVKIEAALDGLQTAIAEREKHTALQREALDVTLPGNRRRIGHRHPLTIVRKEIEDIFIAMGYTVEDGPEVESTYYNFDALNIPVSHPARDPRDTFYVCGRHAPANTYIASANAHDGENATAASHHLSGPRVSSRRIRSDTFAHVPSGRMPAC